MWITPAGDYNNACLKRILSTGGLRSSVALLVLLMSEGIVSPASHGLWQSCVDHLAQELPEQQFNTWIRPLAAVVADDLSKVTIQVGNRFKLDWIRAQYAAGIAALLEKISGHHMPLELAIAPRETLA